MLIGLAVLALLLVAAAVVLYLNRRSVAEMVLVGWLERRGIDAELMIERIDTDGFVGRIRLGDAANPDLTIARVEADYVLGAPWSASGLGPTISRVRLLQPVVRASWRDGKFSLGSLDPLLQELLARPAQPATRGPLILVEGGEVKLDTDYGALQLLGDARLEDGRLMRLMARMPAATLRGNGIELQDLATTVDLATSGERSAIRLEASVAQLRSPSGQGEVARLVLSADLPYPDLASQRLEGPVKFDAELLTRKLSAAGAEAADLRAHAVFDGETAGALTAPRIAGTASFDLDTATVTGAHFAAQGLQAALSGARVRLDRDASGLAWSMTSPATATVARVDAGELSLQQVRTALDLDVAREGAAVRTPRIVADGSVEVGSGAWPLLGAPAADDVPELIEMKRALRRFSIRAPRLHFAADAAGTRLALTEPLRLAPANGGALTASALARPLYLAEPGQPAGGAVKLTSLRGRGLPAATISVPDWHFTDTGFEARLHGALVTDFDVARGIRFNTQGVLVLAGERLSYRTQQCIGLTVDRLQLEENAVTGIAGTVCPDRAPLFTTANGRWTAQASYRDVVADVPFAALRFTDFQGRVDASGSPQGLAIEAAVTRGTAADTTAPARFNPVTASGSASLANDRWAGTFQLASGAQHLGQALLSHDAASRSGGLRIEVPDLVFSEGGLQPAALSALAGTYARSPVKGSVRFEGWMNWAGETSSSGGKLTIPSLDFTSPAGAVEGLKGEIQFTSLMPLATAPEQSLKVDRLVTATDVTAVNLVFTLDAGALRISQGEVTAAGGRLLAMPFSLPLDLTQPFNGTIVLERVQLGKVIADTGMAERITLDAVVSGSLPFVWTPGQGVRIVGGALAAVQPGRLSIRREVLQQVETSSGEQVPPGLVEDLAYQAMENLAFDVLSADVNSLDGGRVGIVFRVKGRHDPPQRQVLRVGLMELISRRFLNRKLPLPSDTGIDLTLDTTLNLNELINDLLEVNRARQGKGGAPAVPAQP